MKKVYQSEKWKKHSLNKTKCILKRRQAENKKIKKRPQYKSVSYSNIIKKKGKIQIKAPSNFSLINNIEETINFFDAVQQYIKEQKNIYFDLSAIKELTTDAILYLLSRLEYSHIKGSQAKISGNFPNDESCKKIFETSGFYSYVYARNIHKIHNDPNVYSIQSGEHVLPIKAKEVSDFTKLRIGM